MSAAVTSRRRFPPPWTIEDYNDRCFIVRDKNRQQLGYFYYEQEPGRRSAASLLTKDEARRLAVNFAKLSELLRDSGSLASQRMRMPNVLNFYMDDSGTRHPDHDPGKRAAHAFDWFALGGILVKDSDEPSVREAHNAFCHKWGITCPIHSVEVRARNKGFLWLEGRPKRDQDVFYEELYQLLKAVPVAGLACVIDRPGYNARYREKYGRQRWSLCKSAFTISVERAAKYARSLHCRLRVLPERCNKKEDRILEGYYNDLKVTGQPFDPNTSEKYRPLAPEEYKRTLLEFLPKKKSSPMAQFADLYLWPICMGGYKADTRPYKRLKEDGKLIECSVQEADWPTLATKYYCFDSQKEQAPETRNPAG